MEENNSGRKLIVVLVVIVLAAIILAVWLSLRGGDETNPAELGFSSAQDANRDAVIEVPDQFPGSVVYVSRADLPAGGWIIVRKNNNGVPGDVIGANFFDRNTRIGNVELTEPTVDGQNYFVQVYTDDGDGQFKAEFDKIVTGRDGQPLEKQFRATRDLPERKG